MNTENNINTDVLYNEEKGANLSGDFQPDNERNKIEKGKLYLVSTPIGNLDDITVRALKALREADFIAAEDTRVTGKLCRTFGISAHIITYQEHNKRKAGEIIVKRLKEGESCALVTDAGTPAISDPGEDIVRQCIDAGIDVIPIPGACAAITALTVSGFSTRRFSFEGFLCGTASENKERLDSLKSEKRTLIFYEAPHRIADTIKLMHDILGDRRVSLCRELTKLNEETIRTTLSDAIRLFDEKVPKGEFVIVIEGADENSDSFFKDMSIKEHVGYYTDKIGLDKMSAMKAAARDRGVSKSAIYKEMLKDEE